MLFWHTPVIVASISTQEHGYLSFCKHALKKPSCWGWTHCCVLISINAWLSACALVCVGMSSHLFQCVCACAWFTRGLYAACICVSVFWSALILRWTLLVSLDKQLPSFSLSSSELRTHAASSTRPDWSTTWTHQHTHTHTHKEKKTLVVTGPKSWA